MLTLHLSPGSSSMAPHIALNEIGVPFEVKALSVAAKDTRTADFLAINPAGKVPALLIDGRLLTEVAGILYYLARKHPEAGLMPAGDPEAEAQIVSWMSYVASTLHPSRREGVDAAREIYKVADGRLGDGWIAGRYSIADIHLFRVYWRFRSFLEAKPGDFPNLDAHHDRMLARPAVAKTIEIEDRIARELGR